MFIQNNQPYNKKTPLLPVVVFSLAGSCTKWYVDAQSDQSRKSTTGQIDSQWPDEIKAAFLKWLEGHPELGKMTRAELDTVMRKRTW